MSEFPSLCLVVFQLKCAKHVELIDIRYCGGGHQSRDARLLCNLSSELQLLVVDNIRSPAASKQ